MFFMWNDKRCIDIYGLFNYFLSCGKCFISCFFFFDGVKLIRLDKRKFNELDFFVKVWFFCVEVDERGWVVCLKLE